MPTATNRHSGSRQPGRGFDLDGAGGDGGEHGQGEHAGQVRWGLGGGGDRSHVLAQPAGQDLDRERGHLTGGPERDGRCPAAPIHPAGGGVGQLAGEVGEHGRVGVGVGQADAEVDHPPAAGRLGDQLGVVAGVGHGGHGLDQGVQERAAADIGQLAGVVQLPQHGDRVGGLAAVGQAEDGSPDGPMGGPVEVGLLEDGGDLGQQPPGGQDRAEHGFLGLEVVGWLLVGCGHRSERSPGRWLARLWLRSSAGAAGATPPPPGRGCGSPLVQDVFDVALGDLQAFAWQIGGDLAHGQVLELFGTEPVQVRLDVLALGDPGAVATHPSRQACLWVL